MNGAVDIALLELLGAGGMGEVWSARHETSGRAVVIKTVRREAQERALLDEAFRGEVEAIARMNHRGIVRVYEYGVFDAPQPTPDGGALDAGTAFLLMERVRGVPLDEALRGAPREEIQRAVLCVLDALAYAHARRVVHRDLKPDNILWTTDARWPTRLIDFGVALLRAHGQDAAGVQGGGTPAYAAPEQVASARGDAVSWRVGPWTDLYALGCLVFELLTGRRPFLAPTAGEVLAMHRSAPRPSLHTHGVDAPALDAWVQRMMAIEPEARYQTASAAAWALVRACAESPEVVRRAPAEEGVSDGAGVVVDGSFFGSGLWSRRAEDPGDPIVAWTQPSSMGTFGVLSDMLMTGWTTPSSAADAPADTPADLSSSDVHATPATSPHVEDAPPVPPRWASDGERAGGLLGVGLGLYAWRAVPMLGREEERDRLWAALRAVCETGTARVVMVRGPSGVGKSRLAMWLARRAHEVGAAEFLVATHAARSGPAHGLGRMVAEHLGLVGVQEATCAQALDAYVRRATPPDPVYEREALDALVGGEGSFVFRGVRPRVALVERVLRRVGRPVVVVLDDAQWGADALTLASSLLASDAAPCPALVVLTVRDEAIHDREDARAAFARLDGHEAVEVIRLGALDPASHEALVHELLGLRGELAARVVERTMGSPLFATQLVGDWIQRGCLELRPEGFALREGASIELPDGLLEFWTGRLVQTLAGFSPAAREAVELAAVLGVRVDGREWAAVCARVGADPQRVLDRLVSLGFAERGLGGWSWAHAMIVEALEQLLAESGALSRRAKVLAAMLDTLHPVQSHDLMERRGRYLALAGDHEAAFSPLIEAARHFSGVSHPRRALLALGLIEPPLLAAGVPEQDPRLVEIGVVRSTACLTLGEQQRALEISTGLMAHLDHLDPTSKLTMRVMLRHACNANGAALEETPALLQRCADHALAHGDLLSFNSARIELAWWWLNRGEPTRALELCDDVLAETQGALDARRRIVAINHSAAALKKLGRYDEAAARRHEALQLLDGTDNYLARATQINGLADIDRLRGDLDAAERGYLNALELYNALGLGESTVARLNLLLVTLQRESWADAVERGTSLLDTCTRQGQRLFAILAHALLAPACAGLARWGAMRLHLQQLDVLREARFVDGDCAWPLELAGDLAFAAGQHELAHDAWSVALVQWRALDRPARVSALEARAARVQA